VADVAKAPEVYRATWYSFENGTGSSLMLGTTESRGTIMATPIDLNDEAGSFARVDIDATSAEHLSWSKPVSAYFRRDDVGWRLVGIDRQ